MIADSAETARARAKAVAVLRLLAAIEASAAETAASTPWLSEESAFDEALEATVERGIRAMTPNEQHALAVRLLELVRRSRWSVS